MNLSLKLLANQAFMNDGTQTVAAPAFGVAPTTSIAPATSLDQGPGGMG